MEYLYKKFRDVNVFQPLVLIDFDHTISDFTAMKREIKKNCLKLGISNQDWDLAYLASKSKVGIVVIDNAISLLSEKYGLDHSRVKAGFYNEFHKAYKYLFDDVVEYLEKTSRDTNIILFSLGIEKFQFIKREYSNIDKYFCGALYTKFEKDEWLSRQLRWDKDRLYVKFLGASFKEIQVIDDRPSTFDKLTNTFKGKLKLIRLKRVGGRYENEKDIIPTEVITSLKDL